MLRYYIIAIVGSMAIIAGLDIAFYLQTITFSSVLMIIANVVVITVAVIGVDAIIAIIIRKLPKKLYNPYLKVYKVNIHEKVFYDKIKIKKWKDRIPELGRIFAGFGKSKVIDTNDTKYMFHFLEETCYAETMHFLSVFIGYTIIIFAPAGLKLCVALPVACVNAVLNALPVLVQRYNRIRLLKIYEINLKRAERKAQLEEAASTKEE